MDFKIAIISHKREDTIGEDSFDMLRNYGIDMQKVFVFVADDELRSYSPVCREYKCNLIKGAKGFLPQKYAVVDFFEDGENVICMDDDIEGFKGIDGKPFKNFGEFSSSAFDLCKKFGSSLWGVYGIDNPYFLKRTITKGLVFINDTFQGRIMHKDDFIKPENRFHPGYETVMKYYLKYGDTIRFNYICYVSREFTHKGGEQALQERTLELRKQDAINFVEKYNLYSCLNQKYLRNGRYEIQFNKQFSETIKV